MTMGLKEGIERLEKWRPMEDGTDQARRVVLDAARAYDHHRSYIDRLQGERDEAHGEVRIARAGKLVAEQALQQTDDALSACRADNAELRRERDESRTAHDVTKSQLIRERATADRARADLVAEKDTNASLRASRELALAELDEKVKRIAELEASRMGLIYCASSRQNTIDEQVQRIAELEGEIRLWDQSATRQTEALRAARVPDADWRKTREAQAIDILEDDDIDLTDGDQKIVAAWLLRWEPKS